MQMLSLFYTEADTIAKYINDSDVHPTTQNIDTKYIICREGWRVTVL